MTFTYNSSNGVLSRNGEQIGVGYAGHGAGLNNPAMESVHSVGPLPRGRYTIGEFVDRPHVGKFAAPLTPDPANVMYGRDGFFMHGMNEQDAMTGSHTSSDGCPIFIIPIRKQVAASGDTDLLVV